MERRLVLKLTTGGDGDIYPPCNGDGAGFVALISPLVVKQKLVTRSEGLSPRDRIIDTV